MARKICQDCPATQAFPSVLEDPELRKNLFTNMSPEADFRCHPISHESYVASATEVSPWVEEIDGFRKENIFHDHLHIGPLGFYRNLGAATCIDFLERGELPHLETDTALRHLWIDFRNSCRTQGYGVPRGGFSLRLLGRSKKSEYPELHSSFKGTTVKILMVFLAQRAGELERGDPYTRTRSTCLWALAEFIWITDSAGVVLSTSEKARLEYAGRLFLLSYAGYANLVVGRNLINPTPKVHYYEEMLSTSLSFGINPRILSCWGEESMIGQLKRLGKMCHGGSMLTTSMLRLFIHFAMRWQERRRTQKWRIWVD